MNINYKSASISKNFFRYLVLTIWLIIILVPIIWVILGSVKPIDEVFKFSLPSKVMFENYIIPFREGNGNSLPPHGDMAESSFNISHRPG